MIRADLVVIGGGLSGCLAAIRAAEAGLQVVLVEKREYLGREITAYNHTFVRLDNESRFNRECPTWLGRLFSMRTENEAMAPEGLTRQYLIDALATQGVVVLYCAIATGVTEDEHGITGVLMATPLGVMHISARQVIDATERFNLGRILADRPYAQGAIQVHAVFEMEQVEGNQTDLTFVEKQVGLIAGSLRVHPTIRKDNRIIEFVYKDKAGDPYIARSEIENRRIAKSGEVAASLRKSVPGFDKAILSHMAYDAFISGDEFEFPAVDGLQPIPSLPWGFSLGDVAECWAKAGQYVQHVNHSVNSRYGEEKLRIRGVERPFERSMLIPYEDEAMLISLYHYNTLGIEESLQSFAVDICVIGSGAGGGMAMLAAAEHGKRVAVVEVNTLMGGTHTVGRVTNYYDGFRGGMSQNVSEKAKQFSASMGDRDEKGGIPHSAYLNHRTEELGVQVFTASIACGVVLAERCVKGVIVANEDGLFHIPATVSVDATGNIDVVAFAGGAYSIGDPETGMVQSYSMWGEEIYPIEQFLMHRFLRDLGICHPDKYSERLRAIRDGHYQNSPYHISPMVTVRESRRVIGEHELTVRDLLDEKTYKDVIAVASSRADSHAFTSSPIARMGGLGSGKEMKVRIPYGCYIPKGIEGLLVAAKALSGERDATSFCRMNADIKNAGYAIGLAAAMASDQGQGVRNIDVPALQSKLTELGILPDWAFTLPEVPEPDSLAARCAMGDEEAFMRVVHQSEASMLPVLEKRYSEGDREYVMQALSWFGSELGGEEVAGLLSEAVQEGKHRTLPPLDIYRAGIQSRRSPLDDYTLINRLIIVSGRSGHPATLEPLAELIADTEGYGKPMPHLMPYDILREDIVQYPFYSRIQNIAYAAAHKSDKRLAPALDLLLSREGITGHATELNSGDHPNFMMAHVEICLARAAIRCGSMLGLKVMSSYLTDTHSFFRQTARNELGLLYR